MTNLEVGHVLADNYRLTRELGHGGMGRVFAAEQLDLGIEVAVKLLFDFVASQPELVERFRREARATLLLNHPNVVRVFAYGEHDGGSYLVMELIDGHPLGEWLERQGSLPSLEDVCTISTQILDALAAAHELGIVHRDLKPDNVLLSETLGVKVVDFGLAHVDDPRREESLTRADAVAGTPAYMSPEQSRSLRVGPSSDLYAFGCVLTELLQLAPPFRGESPVDTISQHLFLAPPALTRPDGSAPIPPLLEKLRLELLAKNPEQRPPGAMAARDRLLEALDPERSARRLPARKDELGAGGRADRIPDWNRGSALPEAGVERARRRVALLSARPSTRVHERALATGLAAHGFIALRARSDAELAETRADLVVLDAENVEDATRRLKDLDPGSRPIVVVLDALDAVHMARLVAAGAAEVATHPLAPDVLARKLRRLVTARDRMR
jgi:predicted Ser/Thr protein kinase/CheY-like chemotaxis protein